MSAGSLALIARVSGLGLMLLAAEASKKNQRVRLGFDKENDSEHAAHLGRLRPGRPGAELLLCWETTNSAGQQSLRGGDAECQGSAQHPK